jgi:AbrB family looped-hinge helix DNA binding protein
MEKTRLSNKGQVVIPHAIRERLGWEPGVEFAVEQIEDGIALRPIRSVEPTTIDEVFGCLPYQGKRKSLDDMQEGIRRGALERR